MASAAASAKILDFTNVKEGGNSYNKKRVPAGDYLAKVTAVEDAVSKKDNGAQWLFKIELVDKYTDRKFPYYCKLEANQLWKIRNLFLAAGVVIPKKKVKLDPNKVVGKMIAVTLDDTEFDGKLQSEIVQTFPPSELDEDTNDDVDNELDDEDEEATDDEEDTAADEDEEEEEEEPAPKKRAAAKASIPAQRKASPKAKVDVDDDELEELDLEEI